MFPRKIYQRIRCAPESWCLMASGCCPWHRSLDGSFYRDNNFYLLTGIYVLIALLVYLVALYQSQLSTQVLEDPVTGLPSRRLFLAHLGAAMTRADREHNGLAIVFIDVNEFKAINDRLGHAQGDQVLREIANRLKAAIRAGDIAARYGGDELVVLAPSIKTPEDAGAIRAKLQNAMRRPLAIGDTALDVSISVGTSLYPDDAGSMEELLAHADSAMYRQKRQFKLVR